MIKLPITGEITAVTPPKSGKSANYFQKLVITVDGGYDGNRKLRDNHYEVIAWAETRSELQFNDSDLGRQVQAECELSGFKNNTDKGTFFNLSLKLQSIKFLSI